MEYLPDKLLINDTLFLQQFMVIWTSTVPTITKPCGIVVLREQTGFVIRYIGHRLSTTGSLLDNYHITVSRHAE